MRIAHITATFPPHRTGTGNVAYNNARELVRRNHNVTVFTAAEANAPEDEVLDGIQVHRLKPFLRYGNAPFLPSLFFKARKFDIIHLHMPFYGGSEAIYLRRKIENTPLVITHHQDVKLKGPASALSNLLDRLVGTPLALIADRVCFTSLDYAQASQYSALMSQRKISFSELSNGVDVEHFTPGEAPSDLWTRYRLSGRNVILFVGGLDKAHYFKGVYLLLQALAQLANQDTSLVIVGQGDLRETYQQQAEDLGLANRVHFAGFVPDEELPDYYRMADVTVLPSVTEGEAFGMVLLESLACGTPVIAAALPGVRTVVRDKQDGFLVKPGDVADLERKLDDLLKLSPSVRQSMGLTGRLKTEETYAWPKIGARLDQIYTEVLINRVRGERQKAQITA